MDMATGGPELGWGLPARLHSHLRQRRLQSGVYLCMLITDRTGCHWVALLTDMTGSIL